MDQQPLPATPSEPEPPKLRAVHLSVVPADVSRHGSSGPPGPDELAGWIREVAQSGSREAFAGLFAHFAPRVKSYLLRAGADNEQAEDLAQETLVTLWRKAALFDVRQAGASTWVFTIARNLRVDRFRRQGGAAALQVDDIDLDTLVQDAPTPDALLHTVRMEHHVRAAIALLPPEQSQVLQLSFYEDEPHARIASLLGIPLGTVKSRVRLAVAHLRRLLASFEDSRP